MRKGVIRKIVVSLCAVVMIGSLVAHFHQHKVIGEEVANNEGAQTLYENKVIVLMYHHIDPVKKSSYTITPELFHQQLSKLNDEHFHVISMKQFLDFQNKKATVPPNAILITFDDGYESFYKYAYPELKKWGFPATNFVIVGVTDKPYLSAIPHLTWDEMREMKANQMTFYSHTYNQHDYQRINVQGTKRPALLGPTFLEEEDRTETQKQYEDRVREDLTLAKMRLEKELGGESQHLLCFPFGAYNNKVIEIAKSIGIDTFFVVQPGISKPGDSIIYRIDGGSPKVTPDDLIHEIREHVDPANNGVSFAPPPIGIKVNGKQLHPTTSPYRKEGKLYVPFRVVLEALGANVQWEQQSQTLTAIKGKKKLVLTVGSNEALINGQKVQMEVPVENDEAAVMVPVRFVGESLGAKVNWNQESNMVDITTK